MDEERDSDPYCSLCGGELVILGLLGARQHSRCRDCGMDSSKEVGMLDDLGSPIYGQKRFEERCQATIVPLTFGRARICLSKTDPMYYDNTW
jgi:hypothetical protein